MPCFNPETLLAFTDNELKKSDAAQVLQHLEFCEKCRFEVEALKELNVLAKSALQGIEVPDSCPVIMQSNRKLSWLAASAASLLIIAVLWVILRDPIQQDAPIAVQNRLEPQRQTPNAGSPAGAAEFATVQQPTREQLDMAFEEWAQQYRNLKIPLAPIEEVEENATIQPVQVLQNSKYRKNGGKL